MSGNVKRKGVVFRLTTTFSIGDGVLQLTSNKGRVYSAADVSSHALFVGRSYEKRRSPHHSCDDRQGTLFATSLRATFAK